MSTKKKTKKRKTNKRRKNNKISFFSILRNAIKDGISKYKNEMRQQVEKHKLLSSKSDWSMIDKFVTEINENPQLKVEITLNDGTKLSLYCYKEEKANDYDLLDNTIRISPDTFM